MICANTRTPEVTWGDINAQVNTNTYGLDKFAELFAKYGTDNVLACWRRWMDICERELRKEIAKVPDGRYGPETDCLDDDGIDLAKPHRISASLEVKGDTLHFILDSDAQARGPINLRPCVSRNFIECLVKMVFIPTLPVNDGLSRPVRVSYPPEGSLLNPRFPGAGEHVRAAEPGDDLGRHARSGARRAGPRAGAGQRRRRLAVERRAAIRIPGRWYSQYEILNGGTGARPDRDGVSAMDELVVNVMNTPVEAVETEFPVRVERYELAHGFRRARHVPRRPRRAPAVARSGRGIDRQSAHRPVQVLLARHVRRQARAALEGRRSIQAAPPSGRSRPRSPACG